MVKLVGQNHKEILLINLGLETETAIIKLKNGFDAFHADSKLKCK